MIFQIESIVKKKLFNCLTCGQCLLSQTARKCPMNCPKGLRNGPCGGTLDEMCEVLTEEKCVWVNIHQLPKNTLDPAEIRLPFDHDLLNQSSYVNFFTGKDKFTRKPLKLDQVRVPGPTSQLSKKLTAGSFVFTCEIHSPKTTKGIHRVEKTMESLGNFFDAFNTTTNAGGRQSIHSTETGAIVAAYGKESIIQFCGRDQSEKVFIKEIETALEQGFQNFLLLTGDWNPTNQPQRNQEHWFPMDSSQMIHRVHQMKRDLLKRFESVPFIGTAANPLSAPMGISLKRFEQKINAGANFTQTQVTTSLKQLKNWKTKLLFAPYDFYILPSIPLVGSEKGLTILRNLPGVKLDDAYLEQIEKGSNYIENSLQWARKMISNLKENDFNGVHIMNFGMPIDQVTELMKSIR